MEINFVAPSPSLTIVCANFLQTSVISFSNIVNALLSSLSINGSLDLHVAIKINESLVDVSPSTVIALNVVVEIFFKIAFKNTDGIFASVNINDSIVAMFGAIIPDPLAIPEIFMSLFPILHSS